MACNCVTNGPDHPAATGDQPLQKPPIRGWGASDGSAMAVGQAFHFVEAASVRAIASPNHPSLSSMQSRESILPVRKIRVPTSVQVEHGSPHGPRMSSRTSRECHLVSVNQSPGNLYISAPARPSVGSKGSNTARFQRSCALGPCEFTTPEKEPEKNRPPNRND